MSERDDAGRTLSWPRRLAWRLVPHWTVRNRPRAFSIVEWVPYLIAIGALILQLVKLTQKEGWELSLSAYLLLPIIVAVFALQLCGDARYG